MLSKNKVDKLTVMGKYRNIRKLWQQYQSSKESLKPSEQECFASCPTMESSEYLCPSIPKASMKPLSRHMRATSISSQRDPSIQKGIFADEHIQENRYLMEVTGKVIEKADYKKNESNMYLTLFTTLPHVFFHPTLDLCVDARYYGNDARFVRRSCHPNAELKTIMIPSQDTLDFVHLGIYTTKQVRRGEEITIPWYWARLNRIKSDFNKNRQVDLDDDLKHEISEMLAILNAEYGECACDDKDTCFVEFLGDEMDETSPSFVEKEQDLAMLSKAGTDSTDEETPIENYHRPSIPPSPAESVHDAGVSNRDALVAMEDKKLPMKKRWLQRFLREKSLQS